MEHKIGDKFVISNRGKKLEKVIVSKDEFPLYLKNYDGKNKHRTVVEDECFIGSNCNVIAPVKISKNTYICAGTTLTQNTNPFDFVIGRTKETIKSNYSQKYFKGGK